MATKRNSRKQANPGGATYLRARGLTSATIYLKPALKDRFKQAAVMTGQGPLSMSDWLVAVASRAADKVLGKE